jgi:hypothetical protein
MFLDEDEIGTGDVEVVVSPPWTFDIFGRGLMTDSCKEEYIAG